MREIIKNIRVPIDGKPMDFRLTKLDAFSGAALLRLLAGLPEPSAEAPSVISTEGEARAEKSPFSLRRLIASIPPADLRSLMAVCLEHVEVLLPAGYIPVMTRGEWSWAELEHDTATCLKLTLEETLWTLRDFFAGGGSTPPSEAPAS